MTNLTRSRRRFTAQQNQESVELCLSEGRQELARLCKENRELRREKDFAKLAAAYFVKEQLPAKGFASEQLSGRFSVQWLCGQLGVARSG